MGDVAIAPEHIKAVSWEEVKQHGCEMPIDGKSELAVDFPNTRILIKPVENPDPDNQRWSLEPGNKSVREQMIASVAGGRGSAATGGGYFADLAMIKALHGDNFRKGGSEQARTFRDELSNLTTEEALRCLEGVSEMLVNTKEYVASRAKEPKSSGR